jgi:uncharacterized protein
MKTLAASAAIAVALAATLSPALARTGYVTDDAHLFSAAAIAQVNQQAGDLYAQTHKEVVVVTTPSLSGTTIDSAIERSFSQQAVNGVEIFISKGDHAIKIAGDTASSRFFPTGSYQSIATSMRASFKAGDYDGGIENAVSLIVNTYRGHESSLNHRSSGAYAPAGAYGTTQTTYHRSSSGGFPMGWIIFLVVLVVIFLIVRGVFRSMTGANRMYPPGGPGGPGYGGPGYGGPGYGGPGYGGGGFGYGGGGGFFSGLLGGLGGAWLGNEMFGGNRGTTIIEENGNQAGFGGGYDNGGQNYDAGGWQNDPGQIDTSNMGGSDWGGGGGDWGGGGGDFGGGGDGGGGGGW